MPDKKLINRFIRFLKTSFGIAKSSIRRYSNKFSRHDFTQHQLMALLCFKKRLRMRYREFDEFLELVLNALKVIGLSKIPHCRNS